MFTHKISNISYLTEIIELQEVPLSIQNQEDEKVFLSNLILEILRKRTIEQQENPLSIPNQEEEKAFLPYYISELLREDNYSQTSIQLICTSNQTEDQIHSATPHFYIAFHTPYENEEAEQDTIDRLKEEIEAISIVLERMGYKIQKVGKINKIKSIPLIPSQLINKEVCWVSNSSDELAHTLRNTNIPFIWDNILNMMSDKMSDSLLTVTLECDEYDNVNSNIQIIAENESTARLLYFNLIQGFERQYSPNVFFFSLNDPFDFWTYFLEENVEKNIISYSELAKIMQLPCGNGSHLKTRKTARMLPPFPPGMINGNGVTLGNIKNVDDKMLTLPLQEKVNHVSILGLSGSGKSNFLLNFLHEMWNTHKIPYLVLDPVTTEYRTLIKEDNTKVFTPGDYTSPLEFNPFMLCCKNVTIKHHKAILKDFLRGVLNLHTPLDRLIDETIDNVFLENGWLDVSTLEHRPGKTFTLNDVIKTFDKVFEESRFTGNLMNIASSGKVRLNALRQWFDTISPLPIERILSTPSIVELQSMGAPESKCTLLLYLLQMTKAYMQATFQENAGAKPRLILVIDEAHSILEVLDQGEAKNLAQQAVISEINKILLEFRKYGLMLVLADQRLSILESQMTNTHLQVIFKQTDYQRPANLIGLEDAELLTRLQAGECFVKYESIEAPVEIKTIYKDRSQHPTDNSSVKNHMYNTFWNKHYMLTATYEGCIKCPVITSKICCNPNNRALIRDYTKMELMKYKGQEIDRNLRNKIIEDTLVKGKLKDIPIVRYCIDVHLNNFLLL